MKKLQDAEQSLKEPGFWSPAANSLYTMAMLYFADGALRHGHTEMDLQKHLRRNLDRYLDGESVPVRSKNGEGLCDLLIRKNGFDCPMEVKLHKFDRSAKKQLRRYIDFYQAPIGYAAAPALTTTLDPDMIFVDVSGWKN